MEDGVWRTIGGRRVYIKKGQSISDAMKESGKFTKKEREKEFEKQKENYSYHKEPEDKDQEEELYQEFKEKGKIGQSYSEYKKEKREAEFEKQINEGYEKFHGKTDKEISDAKDDVRREKLKAGDIEYQRASNGGYEVQVGKDKYYYNTLDELKEDWGTAEEVQQVKAQREKALKNNREFSDYGEKEINKSTNAYEKLKADMTEKQKNIVAKYDDEYAKDVLKAKDFNELREISKNIEDEKTRNSVESRLFNLQAHGYDKGDVEFAKNYILDDYDKMKSGEFKNLGNKFDYRKASDDTFAKKEINRLNGEIEKIKKGEGIYASAPENWKESAIKEAETLRGKYEKTMSDNIREGAKPKRATKEDIDHLFNKTPHKTEGEKEYAKKLESLTDQQKRMIEMKRSGQYKDLLGPSDEKSVREAIDRLTNENKNPSKPNIEYSEYNAKIDKENERRAKEYKENADWLRKAFTKYIKEHPNSKLTIRDFKRKQ